jgi:hypothetical protein
LGVKNNSWTSLSIVLRSIQRWTDSLLNSHRPTNSPWLIRRWLTVSKTLHSTPVRRDARLSRADMLPHRAAFPWAPYFQWYSYWSATNEDHSETAVAEALISGLSLHMDSFESHILRATYCILKPWDAWISVVPDHKLRSLTPEGVSKTTISRSITTWCEWMIEKLSLPSERLSDFHVSHRVIRLYQGQDAAATILCFHDLDALIDAS